MSQKPVPPLPSLPSPPPLRQRPLALIMLPPLPFDAAAPEAAGAACEHAVAPGAAAAAAPVADVAAPEDAGAAFEHDVAPNAADATAAAP
jgi:hypothetical protein